MKSNSFYLLFIASCLLLLLGASLAFGGLPVSALEIGPSSVYPVCSKSGEIICPDNYLPFCPENKEKSGSPKCIQLGSMFVPGCWQFEGIKKIDLGLEKMMLSPTTMVKVIGGGETYTLNRETVFCKKI